MATGQMASVLDLTNLKSLEEATHRPRDPLFFRDGILVGFGWDEASWTNSELPTLQQMDELFPDVPVYFSRKDGHAGLANSHAIQILRAEQKSFFQEHEHFRNLEKIPNASRERKEQFLLKACEVFHQAGFSHVRDLGGDRSQFEIARSLENSGQWNLHVDWNFACYQESDFSKILGDLKACRSQGSLLNEIKGIKFFFDGTLGSKTALLSRCECRQHAALWSEDVLERLIKESWQEGLEVSVHCIGDEAADKIVDLARRVSASGVGGRLNLEHAEILRPETIQKMKPLHVTCHLQPCHWWEDRKIFETELRALRGFSFPWEALRKAKIPFFFGSDSPIEKPSVHRNLEAVSESAKHRVPALKADAALFHVHPAPRAHAETEFEGSKLKQLRFLEGFQRKP